LLVHHSTVTIRHFSSTSGTENLTVHKTSKDTIVHCSQTIYSLALTGREETIDHDETYHTRSDQLYLLS